MYNTKIASRYEELVNGGYRGSDGVEYTVDRDGTMVRVERVRGQVRAARKSVEDVISKISE